jgi:3-methyladenine DNA glycosylase AlkD
MPTVTSVMADLKKKGSEKTRITYARHGMAAKAMFGVSMADLKVIAKAIRGQQALACELYETGNLDAMYLAGLVADGAQMTAKQLNRWAEGAASLRMISEYTVPWVAVENMRARDLAMQWIKSKKEHVASSGWCTYSGLAATKADGALDLAEIEDLLRTVVKGIHSAQNRVRYTMNGFVIAVGTSAVTGRPTRETNYFRWADQPSRILIDQMKCSARARSRLEERCGRPVRAGLRAGEDL